MRTHAHAFLIILFLATVVSGLVLGQGMTYFTAFADSFDDDPVGAVPFDIAKPGQKTIKSSLGTILGGATDKRGIIEVRPAAGSSTNHVLRISDEKILDGTGHSEAHIIPDLGAGPGEVIVRFDLRIGRMSGDTFVCSIVDNRTTPGTGRLVLINVLSEGMMLVNGLTIPVHLTISATYHITVRLDLQQGPDTFTVKVVEKNGPLNYETAPLPTMVDTLIVNEVVFSLTDKGHGWFDIDNVQIQHVL